MHTVGTFAPESEAEARERYEAVGPVAQTVVREVAKAMAFDAAEYEDRVDADVVATARDAIFAESLSVAVGSYEEFEDWRADYDGDLQVIGSENVDRVAWHAPEWAGEAVAATFQDEEDAAVGTLRRQAFGRIYRDRFEGGDGDAAAREDDA